MHSYVRLFIPVILIFASTALHAQDALRAGKVALARRNYSQAISLLQKAKKARPGDGEAYYYTGLVYERTGKKAAAMTEYQRATELRLASDLKENAYWKLVLYYRHIQDWDNLYTVSKRFLAFRPSKQVEKIRDQAEANLDPSRKQVQRLLALAQSDEKQGQLECAARRYAEAARLDPDNIKVLWKAGDAYRKLERFKSALFYYRKAMAAGDDSWYSPFQAGVCYYGLQQFEKAIVSFNQAERRNKRPDKTFTFYLNTGRGLAHLELEQLEPARRALADVQKSPELMKKSAPASILAAMVSVLSKNDASIEQYLEHIGQTDPDRPAVPLLRLVQALNQGDFIEAGKQMDELFVEGQKRGNRLNRYVAQALLLLGHYHYVAGRSEEARVALQRYRSLAVDSSGFQGILFKLAASNPAPYRELDPELAAQYASVLKILSKHPDQAAAIIEGRMLFEEGKREEAWPLLNAATGDPLCRFYLADLQLERGDAELARETLASALREDGSLLERLDDFDELDELWSSSEP